jgi:hypothetical protein
MTFFNFWQDLQVKLKGGENIRNWTAAKGYIGDEFKIVGISDDCVEVKSPNAKTIQYAKKYDFEVMFNNWKPYCSRKLQRQELVEQTRVSKYTMSIIKHLEML